MQQWEYMYAVGKWSISDESFYLLETDGRNAVERGKKLVPIHEILNTWGSMGWELVSHQFNYLPSGSAYLILKRPI